MGTDLLVFALYGAVTVALTWWLSGYMHRVYAGERVILSPVLAPVERAFYAAAGTGPDRPQGWMAYALAVLAFNLAGFVLLFGILRLQGVTPLNPEGIPPMAPDLAFNMAISFVTNTNWQAYGGETEKVALLDAGAQDYVTKPFGIRELLARLRGLLRDRAAEPTQGATLTIADLTIDAAARTVTKAGRPVKLTRKEFDLLWLLASNAGRLVTQGAALEHVWGKAHREDSQYLRVFIRQLRAKIGCDAGNPRYIFTEPGVGYRFADG